MRLYKGVLFLMILVFGTGAVFAQSGMPKSPRGMAATQIDGKWITVDYGRPILRGRRDVFGSGESYGKKMYAGAPVWRLGANKSTRIKTEVDLMFGENKLPAGEYSMFAELAESGWTLIISSHKAKNTGRGPGDGIWGSYGYQKAMDVLRTPMTFYPINASVDQFTIGFTNVTEAGGTLYVVWDKVMAATDFTVAAKKE